jgi:hypothetical protein
MLAAARIRPITNEDHPIYRRGGAITKDRESMAHERRRGSRRSAWGRERELTHVKNRRVNAWGNKLGIKRMFKC